MDDSPTEILTEAEIDALVAYLEAAEAQWQATHPAWMSVARRQRALEN